MESADRGATLPLTSRGIPISLRPFFQEYTLEDLDPARDEYTIIERTLAWGNIPELRWLFETMGEARVREWVRNYGWRGLPRRRLKLWLCVLDIQDFWREER